MGWRAVATALIAVFGKNFAISRPARSHQRLLDPVMSKHEVQK